ncbi:MAG: hypothetical protein IMZ71_00715 [Chloroflexi bacterium]|nr:hypothetical protein [Chloroflexota bacterium]
MKFKAYGWWTFHTFGVPDDDDKSLIINLIPSIDIHLARHNFAPNEDIPIRRKGTDVFILVAWLICGFTLDFRFGRDTGYWPGHDEE